MAKCENCGRKLRLMDWKQNCPACGVNLNYFNANERLLADSEKAEIEHAHFQPRIDRAKASYAGSWMAIVRIVLTVIPLAALMLPIIKVDGTGKNAIDVYKFIAENNFGDIFSGAFSGNTFYLSLVFELFAAAMFLVTLISFLAALGKHGKVRNIIINSIQLIFALAAMFTFNSSSFVSEKNAAVGIGTYVFIGLICIEIIWNIAINKVGIPVNYTVCLIGGLPSDEYFSYVEQGMTKMQIRRKMLVALAELNGQENTEETNAIKEAIQNNA